MFQLGTGRSHPSPLLPHNGLVQDSQSSPKTPTKVQQCQSHVLSLLNDLRATLEGVEDKARILHQMAPDTYSFLRSWLSNGVDNMRHPVGAASCYW